MKKYLTGFPMLTASVFTTNLLTGCSEDVTVNNDENDGTRPVVVRDGTVFSDETDGTRTSIGQNGWFYWETGDQIWVDENKDGTFSLESDESELATDKRTANFYFLGKRLQKGPYDLTYTGNGSASGTSVTIKADQSQLVPNDSAHIGTSGDCATATATQKPNGNYEFTLNHKAHYLIFQPYKPDVVTDGWRLMSIEIIDADGKTICGTYKFGMGGLDQTNPTGNTQSKVTLTCGGTSGYLLLNQTAWNSSKDSWYAVIAPDIDATSRNLKIKYNIKPTGNVNFILNTSEATFTIIKELTISSAPNKVTRIRHQLSAESYLTNVYYMWDAAEGEYFWKGVANPPTVYGGTAVGNANEETDSRWYNTVAAPAQATRSCRNLPNANAASWYAMAGDPRWETNMPWCLNGDYAHIYTRGAWILKKRYILENEGITENYMNSISYDRTRDLLQTSRDDYWKNLYVNSSSNYLTNGRPSPSEIDKYFFLPALGHTDYAIENHQIRYDMALIENTMSIHGCYWTSSACIGTIYGEPATYYFSFDDVDTGVSPNGYRFNGRTGIGTRPDGSPWFQ